VRAELAGELAAQTGECGPGDVRATERWDCFAPTGHDEDDAAAACLHLGADGGADDKAEVLRRWWHAEHSWETPIAEVDARVGGAIRLVMRNPADGSEYAGRGQYTVVDPPRRLAFSWTWESEASRRQLVEIELIDHGERTTVVMTNTGIPEAETDEYRDGWQNSFDNLDITLAA
jgi:uncharacterized protein YndB with AHSA1/START domain